MSWNSSISLMPATMATGIAWFSYTKIGNEGKLSHLAWPLLSILPTGLSAVALHVFDKQYDDMWTTAGASTFALGCLNICVMSMEDRQYALSTLFWSSSAVAAYHFLKG